MTTFTITEREGWWVPTVRHRGISGRFEVERPASGPIEYAARVGILEAARAVTEVWPDARLVGIQ